MAFGAATVSANAFYGAPVAILATYYTASARAAVRVWTGKLRRLARSGTDGDGGGKGGGEGKGEGGKARGGKGNTGGRVRWWVGKARLGGALGVVAAFVLEAGFDSYHIYAGTDSAVSMERNVGNLATLLLWLVFASGTADRPDAVDIFYVPWTLSLAWEAVGEPLKGGAGGELCFTASLARMAIMAALLASCLLWQPSEEGAVAKEGSGEKVVLANGCIAQEGAPLKESGAVIKESEVATKENGSAAKETGAAKKEYGVVSTEILPATAEAAGKESEGKELGEKDIASLFTDESDDLWSFIWDLRIFLPYIWPSKRLNLRLALVGIVLCLCASSYFNAMAPQQLRVLFNYVETQKSVSIRDVCFCAFITWASSDTGVSMLKEWISQALDANSAMALKSATFTQLMSLSSDFHDSKRSGELYSAIDHAESIISLLNMSAFKAVPMVVDLLIACSYLVGIFGPYMCLILAYTVLLFIYTQHHLAPDESKIIQEYMVHAQKESQVMHDSTGNYKTVAYFHRFDYEIDRYATSVKANRACRTKMFRSFDAIAACRVACLEFGRWSALLFAAFLVQGGTKSFSDFVLLYTYWRTMSGSLTFLYDIWGQFYQDLINAKQLIQLFRLKPSVQGGSAQLELSAGEVTFDNINFSYDGKRSVIDGLSFTVRPGQTVALVGETGAGKSTVLKLLFRMYNLGGGRILIDGQDTTGVTLASLRAAIGFVPQDGALFNDTIMYNVRYARLGATDDEVMDACRAAAIHDKIMTFTHGYASKVGEHGVKLSGGELQRITIARAILKDPRIVLLDEATSSVDSRTEAKIQAALRRLTAGRTTFVVAHRLSTVMEADQILVMRNGAVAEHGSPRELLDRKGEYYDLWTKQVGLFRAPAPGAETEGGGAGGESGRDGRDGKAAAAAAADATEANGVAK